VYVLVANITDETDQQNAREPIIRKFITRT